MEQLAGAGEEELLVRKHRWSSETARHIRDTSCEEGIGRMNADMRGTQVLER